MDPSIKGAVVRCYVPAGDEDTALDLLRSAFDRDLLKLDKVEWCVNFESTEWENPDNEEALKCVRQAEKSGEVVYGETHGWTDDER